MVEKKHATTTKERRERIAVNVVVVLLQCHTVIVGLLRAVKQLLMNKIKEM